ncbi:uncharacterized protein [Aegilops tauschii subsp. strangulata]|uniref:uncharacterized protein n=1 Tax=Aegilops tauschii subsp. strangulata TaxID=200361 RepID=UPI003CC851E2
MSDHRPLLLDATADLCMGRRFKFEAFWPKLDKFSETVAAAWALVPQGGNPFVVLDMKLRAMAKKLKQWSDRQIGNVKLRITIAMEVISRLDKAMDTRTLSPLECSLQKALKKKLLGLWSLERTIARQRSRILGLRKGDASTSFFQHARHRQRKNFIAGIRRGDNIATNQEEIMNEVDDHFTQMLGEVQERAHSLDLNALRLPSLNLSHLEEPFTEEEIKRVVKSMPPDKAPGPDGDLMNAFNHLYNGDTRGLPAINKAIVALLPKKSGAVDIRDFRPVSLHGAYTP